MVVHDNWPVTHARVCVPFLNWRSTLALDPNRTTGSRAEPAAVPATCRLYQNKPNPFNYATIICFDLPAALHVRLEIYDILGQRLAVVADRKMSAGSHRMYWDARDFPSGVYLYRLTAGAFQKTKKGILLK